MANANVVPFARSKSRHNSIASRAMLSSLRISAWGATRTDQRVTQEVAQRHNVDAKRAGKYYKHAIDPKTVEYAAIYTVIGAMRARHYYWTLPWAADGSRILPAANFEKYSADMRLLRAEFDRAVAEFCKAFPRLVHAARAELGSLFDQQDYPDDVAGRYRVEISIMPLPDAQDFRVDLPDEAIDEIRANIQKEMEATAREAMREPFNRLFERVHHIVDRLSDPKAVFRDSMIEGLRELIDVLPGLNITNDDNLNDFANRAQEMLAKMGDADTLRGMPERRKEIAAEAAQIESDMAAFMGVIK